MGRVLLKILHNKIKCGLYWQYFKVIHLNNFVDLNAESEKHCFFVNSFKLCIESILFAGKRNLSALKFRFVKTISKNLLHKWSHLCSGNLQIVQQRS